MACCREQEGSICPFRSTTPSQLSLDARLRCDDTLRSYHCCTVILTLDPLTRARLSEVSYRILGLYATDGVLLSMPARLGHPLLILSEHRQPQSQRRVHKQLLKHGEQEVKVSKKLCRTALPVKPTRNRPFRPLHTA